MKITVYTVSDCQFSKAEKDYLKLHNFPYEEKNLEQNREWLTEMLNVSNNFAGTPVTKIEKDDGTIVVLKGFTKEEFDQALGFSQEQAQQEQPLSSETSQTPKEPLKQEEVNQSQSLETSQTQTQQNDQQTVSQNLPSQPSSELSSETSYKPNQKPDEEKKPNTNDPLSSILTDLEKKVEAQNPQSTPQPKNDDQSLPSTPQIEQPQPQNQSTQQPPPSSSQPDNLPNIPDFQDQK